MKKSLVFLFLVVCVSGSMGGCHKQFIPNTEIEDNQFNRDIIKFCERYRHAVEDLNVGLLLSLASPRYFDNSGTIDGGDDFDKKGLETHLVEKLSGLKAMRFEIKYRNIFERDGIYFVEFTYTTSFQYVIGDKNKWHNKTADNRLELERVDNNFLIVSGM